MPLFVYRLYSRDGDEFGEFRTASRNWRVGDSLMTGDGRRFRVLSILPLKEEHAAFNATFIVVPIEDRKRE